MFENHRKSLIQHCELLNGQKFIKNAKNGRFNGFRKTEASIQTVLPDRSVLIRQKLVENTKIQKLKCGILSHFQTIMNLFELIFKVI